MIRYPRVLIIKRIKYIPTYQELYQVDTMRPNRPMRSKFGLSKSQANSFARQELAVLKSEGYEKAVFNSSMVDLRKFVLWSLCAPIWLYGGVFFGGACRPTPLAVLSSTSIFLDRTYPTSSCVAFTFRRCLCRRKRCLKRYGRDY